MPVRSRHLMALLEIVDGRRSSRLINVTNGNTSSKNATVHDYQAVLEDGDRATRCSRFPRLGKLRSFLSEKSQQVKVLARSVVARDNSDGEFNFPGILAWHFLNFQEIWHSQILVGSMKMGVGDWKKRLPEVVGHAPESVSCFGM